MAQRSVLPSFDRARAWRRLLWLLAAGLAIASVVSSASIIHDTGRRRVAAQLVTRATAAHVAALAEARLAGLALDDFAAVTPRATFRVDLATGAVRTAGTVDDGRVIAAARRAARDSTAVVRVAVDSTDAQWATVTIVERDTARAPIAVRGAIVETATLMRAMFGDARGGTEDSTVGVARLDARSLEVRSGATTLYGTPDTSRAFHAAVDGTGALDGLAIHVALAWRQLPAVIVTQPPTTQLWGIGVLLLCAGLAAILAAAFTGRELRLVRARSEFVAGVSHDLRMPLAQILLAGETIALEREADGPARVRLARSIVREANRLVALVDNVLLFSRSASTSRSARQTDVSVDALFTDVLDAVRLAVDDAGQTIETTLPATLQVRGDRALLRQALVNLVHNAIKYGATAQCIRLGAERRGGRIALYVDDAGPGIPRADRRRVFDAYERLDRDRDSERTGTGLGLAVVKHVATACGGHAAVEDAPGGGARVVIELAGA